MDLDVVELVLWWFVGLRACLIFLRVLVPQLVRWIFLGYAWFVCLRVLAPEFVFLWFVWFRAWLV